VLLECLCASGISQQSSNAEGETIYSLLRVGDIDKLEQALLEWLDDTIERESRRQAAE
jgi:hypothetical protein